MKMYGDKSKMYKIDPKYMLLKTLYSILEINIIFKYIVCL